MGSEFRSVESFSDSVDSQSVRQTMDVLMCYWLEQNKCVFFLAESLTPPGKKVLHYLDSAVESTDSPVPCGVG